MAYNLRCSELVVAISTAICECFGTVGSFQVTVFARKEALIPPKVDKSKSFGPGYYLQPAGACDAPVCAINKANREREGQNRRGRTATSRLEDELGNGHVCRGVQNGLGIRDAKEDNQNEGNSADCRISCATIIHPRITHVTPPTATA